MSEFFEKLYLICLMKSFRYHCDHIMNSCVISFVLKLNWNFFFFKLFYLLNFQFFVLRSWFLLHSPFSYKRNSALPLIFHQLMFMICFHINPNISLRPYFSIIHVEIQLLLVCIICIKLKRNQFLNQSYILTLFLNS